MVIEHTCEEGEAEWCQHRCEPAHTAGTCGTCAAAHTTAALRPPGPALPPGQCIAERRRLQYSQGRFDPGRTPHLSPHLQSPEQPEWLLGRDSGMDAEASCAVLTPAGVSD